MTDEMVGLAGSEDPVFTFRDGTISPPRHLAAFIARIPDLHTLTYAQAVERVNAMMLGDHMNVAVSNMVKQHFGG